MKDENRMLQHSIGQELLSYLCRILLCPPWIKLACLQAQGHFSPQVGTMKCCKKMLKVPVKGVLYYFFDDLSVTIHNLLNRRM